MKDEHRASKEALEWVYSLGLSGGLSPASRFLMIVDRLRWGEMVPEENVLISNELIDLLDRLGGTEAEKEIVDCLQKPLSNIGVTTVSLVQAGVDPDDDNSFDGGVMECWRQRYLEHQYWVDDPVPRLAILQNAPMFWTHETAFQGLTKKGRQILDEAYELGISKGYIIPIFRKGNFRATGSYICDPLFDDPRVLPTLHLLTIYLQGHLLRLKGKVEVDVPPDRLSSRELECLKWVAEGKSDWEIGEILSISKSTAHNHVENIKQKLDVSTRMQAVIYAMREGIL